jgi:hypothetical protein
VMTMRRSRADQRLAVRRRRGERPQGWKARRVAGPLSLADRSAVPPGTVSSCLCTAPRSAMFRGTPYLGAVNPPDRRVNRPLECSEGPQLQAGYRLDRLPHHDAPDRHDQHGQVPAPTTRDSQLERLKWSCWHGNVFRTLQIIADLQANLDIDESSMRWTPRSTHLLLQICLPPLVPRVHQYIQSTSPDRIASLAGFVPLSVPTPHLPKPPAYLWRVSPSTRRNSRFC